MPSKQKPKHAVKPLTNTQIKHLAGEALVRPSKLNAEQIRRMGGALLERSQRKS